MKKKKKRRKERKRKVFPVVIFDATDKRGTFIEIRFEGSPVSNVIEICRGNERDHVYRLVRSDQFVPFLAIKLAIVH